jgi:PAS domain S-box-containing protein
MAVAVSLLLTVVVGLADYLTGPELGFSIFYLLPVALAAWGGGRAAGLAVSVASASVCFVGTALTARYSHPAIIYWNAAVDLGMFAIVSVLLSDLKRKTVGLEDTVRRRTAALIEEANRHKQTAEALRESQERVRRLTENLKDRAVFMIDPAGRVVTWNEGAERLTGYLADEIIGSPLARLYPTQDADSAGKPEEAIAAATAQGVFEEENWWVRKDGSQFWCVQVLTPLRDAEGRLTGFSEVLHDITDRKRYEEELLEIEERQRQRIGHDLHDALGQDLVGTAFLCKELEELLSAKGIPEAAQAARIVRQINQAIDRTRALAKGLCPVELTASGLMTALEELALNAQEVFGVECVFECGAPVLMNDDVSALHLYRIAQEAVTNAIKHGQARHIAIRLTMTADRHTMSVIDDGGGLPDGAAGYPGMGLQIMRYRARSIGGVLEVGQAPGGGVRVLCSVPAGTVGRRLERDDPGTEG